MRKIPQVLVLLVAAPLVVGVTTASPANQTINLCATTGSVTLPGNVAVPVWGFVDRGSAPDCDAVAGTATVPGPELRVDEGDTVTLTVTNRLPGRTISLDIPGIGFDAGPADAAFGSTVSRTFTASAPGTYLYESSGDGERQTAMGLYGALVVRSATAGRAYDTAASAYDVEARLVLSAIDPAFNADPDHFDMRNFNATYWLINGKAYPDTAEITGAPGSTVLLRWVSAGPETVTMTMANGRAKQIAQDGELLANPFSVVADTLPAGSTADALVTIPPAGERIVLYNRQMHLVNGTGSPALGGMLTAIHG
jgi:FtsP/CotA-like multicopper oxidase with cupredoxin domain